MHILFITNLYSPYIIGGTEIYLQNLLQQLSVTCKVSLITTAPYSGRTSLKPQMSREGNFRIYRFFPANVYHLYKRPNSSILKAIWYLLDIYNVHAREVVRKILSEEKPDLVHTHNLRGLSVSVWDAIKDAGIPLVHTLHDFQLLCRNGLLLHGKDAKLCGGSDLECRIYRPMMRQLTNSKPDMVLSPSQFVLDKFKQAGFLDRSSHALLPLWADAPDLQKTEATLGISLRLLYMGVVSRHKGVRYLVNAFMQLKDCNAHLEIAGIGDEELDECRQLARHDNRIKFLNFVNGHEKEKAFMRANVVALPSIWYDNSPVIIYESFARGKPVIASRIGGIPELVQHEYNGLLFEPHNTKELAGILERLNQDSELLALLSRNASTSSNQYTREAHVHGLLRIYNSVISNVSTSVKVR